MSDVSQPKPDTASASLSGSVESMALTRKEEIILTQPNEQLIETIEKALKAATPGTWEVTNLGDVHITTGYRMNDGRHSANWIADMCEDDHDEEQIFADAHLIANAPEWLRALLEENRNLRSKLEALEGGVIHERK